MDDLISRLSELRSQYSCFNDSEREAYHTLSEAIEALQEQKTGKWVHGRELSREMIGDCIIVIRYDGWKCSECDCLVEEEREPLYKFCPNCGAKMEV